LKKAKTNKMQVTDKIIRLKPVTVLIKSPYAGKKQKIVGGKLILQLHSKDFFLPTVSRIF
jgi:hypothetical protein